MKYKASNGLEIEYEIIRKKNKNVYFRVKEDLKLYITAPIYVSGRSLLKLIEKNEESILKMYEKQEAKSNEVGKYHLLGETYYVEIKPDCEKVTFVGNRVQTPSQDYLDMYTKDQIDKVFGREIELCKKCFASLPEFTWKARYMKTRWGVCNTRTNQITLNTDLIEKDIDLIEYVIIHELCHFFEANHSKEFWELVGLAYPKYKQARKRLKD